MSSELSVVLFALVLVYIVFLVVVVIAISIANKKRARENQLERVEKVRDFITDEILCAERYYMLDSLSFLTFEWRADSYWDVIVLFYVQVGAVKKDGNPSENRYTSLMQVSMHKESWAIVDLKDPSRPDFYSGEQNEELLSILKRAMGDHIRALCKSGPEVEKEAV